MQLRATRDAQAAAAQKAQASARSAAAAVPRASVQRRQEAAAMLEQEQIWQDLKVKEAEQRKRLAEVLEEFRQNTGPVQTAGR